jgi:hypothetical protein
MWRATSFCIALFAVASIAGTAAPQPRVPQVLPTIASCRHDSRATDVDRNRRAQARALAKAINTAEGESARRTRAYQPLSALGKLPPVPDGFSLKLFADRDGYMFALKDTLDPCHYAVFSDAAGFLYEQSGRAAPVIAQ